MGKNKLPVIEKVEITDIAAQGKALTRVDNYVTFVSNALPGDVVDIQVIRRRKKYQEARAIQFHQFSDKRALPFCSHFGTCGGCRWQNLKYDEQLFYKQKEVADTLERLGKVIIPEVSPIIRSDCDRYYRNKLEFTFSNNRWLSREEIDCGEEVTNRNSLGFHIPGKFDKVLDIIECYLQPEPSNSIRNALRDFALSKNYSFFDLINRGGLLRNLIIRTASTGETMIIVVFYDTNRKAQLDVLQFLQRTFQDISSLMYTINRKANDSLTDLEFTLHSGKDHIIEQLDGLKFKIGPNSFFQTNTNQALKLYRIVRDFCNLNGEETVYDLYTGAGTIANFIAKHAGKVIGMEYVEEAVRDAKINSNLNGIDNTRFISGDIKEVFTEETIKKEGYPGILITDPPRAGMHKDVIEQILKVLPERIVYVSCNPATQARDIGLLSGGYSITKVQAIDMFPQTYHVENVVLMERKKNERLT